mmetsp:Transcript_7756/g.20512  ORF Transcript_7756/g.20512 Transcript_7756/m.20512 type:complete len:372 (+) Transcript_7756:134-1249(+)|eukprot:CAMPEP_0185832402 /NCGR_PEP_ID=MMETSP1353-20130828/2058_1 /TAXON_ID=1077150 /ORGANISM="Erythrolobus australicus, Strain CCMP3124" /LENGTH=371 /DNA_ID=CAMNT_0028530571 /DNA_START=127 /DNA_END=1242 /DNA_ORIENTATION=-
MSRSDLVDKAALHRLTRRMDEMTETILRDHAKNASRTFGHARKAAVHQWDALAHTLAPRMNAATKHMQTTWSKTCIPAINAASRRVQATVKSSAERADAHRKRLAKEYGVSEDFIRGLVVGLAATTFVFAGASLFERSLTRVRAAGDITNKMIDRNDTFIGTAVKVGDGDNFRLLHEPPLRRLASTVRGMFGAEKIPKHLTKGENTIHVRLAGVDAPECAHFGRPGQPHAKDAHKWLIDFLEGKRVKIQVLRKDQYGRVVASVTEMPSWFRRARDVSEELVRAGYAVVYRGKEAVYNGALTRYEAAERAAQAARRGMWINGTAGVVGPQEFKRAFKSNLKNVAQYVPKDNFVDQGMALGAKFVGWGLAIGN